MVASRHPSSRPAGAGALHRQIGLRPASSRSPSGSVSGGCRDQRPQLRLVINNTACGSGGPSPAGSRAMRRRGAADPVEGDPGSIATELGAWLRASAGLAEARWRLVLQRCVNRYGHFEMIDRIAGIGPVVAGVAVIVFGALIGLRIAQESSGSPAPAFGTAGSVAAVATSTSSTDGSSNLLAPARPGSSVVVVHPGDSLWSIAVSRYPDHDPRAVVDAFVELNGGSMVRAGQQLIVPAALVEG